MAALTTAVVTRGAPLNQATGGAGAPVAVAASGGDTFAAGPDVFLRFTGGAASCVVTVATPGAYNGLAFVPYTVTVPATTGDVEVGPFPAGVFTADGTTVNLTYSAPTGVKVAVKRYPS
jgi:hypothetical protein